VNLCVLCAISVCSVFLPYAAMESLVIGYGNALRGDDGVGPCVATHLASTLNGAPVRALAIHQLLPELAEPISQAALVIFVDACVGSPPGAVAGRPLAPLDTSTLGLGHHLTPAALLAYAQQLYGRCPPAHLVTITGQDFGYTEQLSAPAETAVDEAVALIHRLLNGFHKPG
jgi:hydrogenase maturation protease